MDNSEREPDFDEGTLRVLEKGSIHRFAGIVILICIAVFIVMTSVAIYLYPGGTQFNNHVAGFDFLDNFLCDLVRRTAINGQPNLWGSKFITVAMFVIIVAFVPLWLVLPHFFPTRSRLAAAIRISGVLSIVGMIGVPLTPSDRMGILHAMVISLAAVPGLIAAVMSALCLISSQPVPMWLKWLTAVMVFVAAYNFIQYANHVWFGQPCTSSIPIVQKIAIVLSLIWMASIGYLLVFQRRSNRCSS